MVPNTLRLLAILSVQAATVAAGGAAAETNPYIYCQNNQGSHGNLVHFCTLASEQQALNQPQWIQAHINRATSLIALNRYLEAIRDLDVVTGLRPNEVQPIATRARLYHSLGRLQEAHDEYVECAKRTRDPGCRVDADVIGAALHPEKSDWDLNISNIVRNTIDVNGRQVFERESGSGTLDLNRYFKTGNDEIIIHQKHILNETPGVRVEIVYGSSQSHTPAELNTSNVIGR